jgi:membrane-associated protein
MPRSGRWRFQNAAAFQGAALLTTLPNLPTRALPAPIVIAARVRQHKLRAQTPVPIRQGRNPMQFFQELYTLLTNLGEAPAWEHFITFVGGPATVYIVMCGIVFVETGFVVMPFLPGDSLLFALGAIGSQLPDFNYKLAAGLLILAALLGDNVNYWVGRKLGPLIFSKEADAVAHGQKPSLFVRLLNKKHLHRTEIFFAKHGAKAVVLARFVAIIRTFTPFVAGLGRMHYGRFLLFSFIGAIVWVTVCVGAGVMLGQVAFVKKHFELVILAIIAVTVIPVGIEVYKGWRESRRPALGVAETKA